MADFKSTFGLNSKLTKLRLFEISIILKFETPITSYNSSQFCIEDNDLYMDL